MSKTNLFSVKNKRIVVTGGLGLIGQTLVTSLASFGAIVYAVDLMPEVDGSNLLGKLVKDDKRANVLYVKCDITKKEDLLSLRKKIGKKGGINVLINNAALNPKVESTNEVRSTVSAFEHLELENWNKELEVNLTGAMLCAQVFGSKMKSGDSIINIASIYGVVAPDMSIYPKGFYKPMTYGVTKAGVINMTKYLAGYWGEKNIRVNCLVFGGVENGQSKQFVQKYSQKTMLRRMAKTSDFIGGIVFLASDASTYCTGSTVVIDGGWTAM